ncbi:MAG: hypothetical protein LUQ07_07735 [Methanospirillum sp.]|nr:hypothetical protein [Methanospirillum sp.]
MNLNEEVDLSQMAGIIQKLVGYIGVVALLIGGVAMYLELPIIGRITCLYCPTQSGILYIILAIVAGFLIYKGLYKFLYLTGGLAFVFMAWDVYSATSIGYALSMIMSGGLTPSMGGGQIDPVMANMMQNTQFSIPTGWIVVGIGALLMIIVPQIEQKTKEQSTGSPREVNLRERMQELDKLVRMYKEGDLSKQEFARLKEEIIGQKIEK